MVGVLARPRAAKAPVAVRKRASWPRWAPVAAVLLLAFGARAIRPDFVPLNSDEAYFVQIAHDGTFLQAMHTTEAHPPLYLALLQGWMLAAGVTEYAIRYLSLLLGVALVAAIYVLGRLLLDRPLGLAAAFAAAVNPYQIIYSHTARDYQLACLFGVISLIALLRARRRPRLLPAFVLAALAALYSHYYGLAIVGFEAILVLVWLIRRDVRWRPWLLAGGAILLGYAPWLVFASRVISGYDLGHGSAGLVRDTLATTFEWYTIGQAHGPGALLAPGILTGVVLLAGALTLARRSRGALALAAGFQLAPIVFAIASFIHTGQFGPRLVYLGSPGYLLLLGAGILAFGALPWLQLAPAGLLAVLGGMSIWNTAFTEHYATEGYRQLAAYLADHIQPGDAVVLDGTSQAPQFWYYAQLRHGLANTVAFMPRDASGGGALHGTVDLPETERALQQLAAGASDIWFVDADALTYDPLLDTERLLATNWFEVASRKFGYDRLEYFSTAAPGPPESRADVAGDIQLVQAALPSTPVPAGQAVDVSLVWRALRDGPPPFKQSLRLVDAAGQVVAQQDGAPQGGFADFGGWRWGADLKANAGLIVPVGVLPGQYGVQLVAYDAVSGRALGPAIALGTVAVDHSAPQRAEASDLPLLRQAASGSPSVGAGTALGGTHPPGAAVAVQAGAVAAGGSAPDSSAAGRPPPSAALPKTPGLTAAEGVTGASAEGSAPLLVAGELGAATAPAGGRLALTLLWQGGPTATPASAGIDIAGATMVHQIGGDAYPSTRWQADDLVRDAFTVRVPVAAKPGTYGVLVSGVRIGSVRVTPSQASFTPPRPKYPVSVRFGDLAELVGYDAQAGRVTLYWHVLQATDTDCSVFLHATGRDGQIKAQVDALTGSDDWVPGSYVSASYDLHAPAGTRISVGLYEAVSGQRLQLASGGDELTLFST